MEVNKLLFYRERREGMEVNKCRTEPEWDVLGKRYKINLPFKFKKA